MDTEKKKDRRSAVIKSTKIKAARYTLGKIIFHQIKSGDTALWDQMLALVNSVEPCDEFGAVAIEDLIKILGQDAEQNG